jgi:hypothetical protein
MIHFDRARRAPRSFRRLAGPLVCSIVCSWLALVQPGMSYYWLIDPDVHARIDEKLYGQMPNGETLPGHEHHLPHDHPTGLGTTVPELTLTNPFDATFYHHLFSAAQRQALRSKRVEIDVIARSIAIEPPEQPPRTSR